VLPFDRIAAIMRQCSTSTLIGTYRPDLVQARLGVAGPITSPLHGTLPPAQEPMAVLEAAQPVLVGGDTKTK
jgi:hypothetical protein